MVKEVIFDFDGTVADSFDIIMSIFSKFKCDLGLDNFGEKEIKIYRTKGVEEILKNSKVSMLKINKIIGEMRKEANETMLKARPFDGIISILREMKKRGLTLGIMSTNGEKTINKFLEINKIKAFDYVIGKGSLLGKDKVIKSILRKRKLKTDEVLYIGDEVRDIKACKKLGIKIVAVTWGFNTKSILEENNPDYLVDSPKEILGVF